MSDYLNVMNTEDIKEYLKRYCGENTQLQNLLIAALFNIIKKSPQYMETLKTLPDDAPAWLKTKWHEAPWWHRFDPKRSIYLAGQIYSIVSWLELAIENEMNWLSHCDAKGRPYKLLKAGSMKHLERIMDKDWDAILNKRREEAKEWFLKNHFYASSKRVMSFEDGAYIIELQTKEALLKEGAYLRHCLADGRYDDCLDDADMRFYSLRDKNNLPHITMLADNQNHSLSEIGGYKNSYPKNKYIGYIATFCSHKILDMSGALSFQEGYSTP